jgi:hypothetical protein
LNMQLRKRTQKPVELHEPKMPDNVQN